MKFYRMMKYALVLLGLLAFADRPAVAADFDAWLTKLRAEALSKGIAAATLDHALAGIQPIPRVIELDRRQPEFTLTFAQYMKRVVNQRRIDKGRALLVTHQALLAEVSQKYNVQPRFIVALWGIETDFGRITGGFPVIAALATLAFDGRRSAFFRKELILALKIIDAGHIKSADMKGSWAGAMGQNQFMPSSFHNFAVDHDGNGRKDIWGTLPDVFASIANYLSKSGWRGDQTWGRKIALPDGIGRGDIGRKRRQFIAEWQAQGVRRDTGADLPTRQLKAAVVAPDRKSIKPAYLVYNNYNVILKWNRSDYFATAVGILSDQLRRQK